MNRSLVLLLITLLAGGCATSPVSFLPPSVNSLPTDALITQRAVLTARGRQFTLNGYLSRSAVGGQRLILTENFGGVLADLLIKPDGSVHVIRSSRAFKESWIRHHIAADVQCLFGDAPRDQCPGRQLSDTHFVIERRWYTLDLQIVETRAGPQSPDLFTVPQRSSP